MQRSFRPLIMLILAVLIGISLAALIVIPTLHPPREDIEQLLIFMVGSGTISALATYFLFRRGGVRWFRSLRQTMLVMIGLAIALIFANVWLVAQLMFISTHDLVLTSALLVFAGLIAAVSAFFIASTLIEQIQALARASDRLAHGELRVRLNTAGNDELAQLAHSFNQMAESLQAADDQKRQLEQARRDWIAWVSHDLRTPLAALRVMNEAILDGVASDPQTIGRYTRDMQREIQHLSRLIDDLFELSRMEAGELRLDCEPTSLRDLLSDTLGSIRVQAERDGISVKGKIEGQIDGVNIAPDKVQRVLYNLLDNALRYTPRGGCVSLCAERKPDHVLISVHNTGSAIADGDLPHIFQSFYQGTPSRAKAQNGHRGTGLGLAIARGFVEAHGGKIWVESASGDGTRFFFTLPLT